MLVFNSLVFTKITFTAFIRDWTLYSSLEEPELKVIRNVEVLSANYFLQNNNCTV